MPILAVQGGLNNLPVTLSNSCTLNQEHQLYTDP